MTKKLAILLLVAAPVLAACGPKRATTPVPAGAGGAGGSARRSQLAWFSPRSFGPFSSRTCAPDGSVIVILTSSFSAGFAFR